MIVVDNGSADDTVEVVRERYPAAHLVELDRNYGFAGGVNRGVEQGNGQFVVLVNNDVECDPNFLAQLVAPFDDGRVGLVAGLLLRPGRETIDAYGLECDATLAAYPRFADAPYPDTTVDEEGLLGPSGGAAAYRREAFEAAGGLDEGTFAYMEDVDLALRLRELGWTRGWGARGDRDPSRLRRPWPSLASPGRDRQCVSRLHAPEVRRFGRGLTTAAWALAFEVGVTVVDVVTARDLAAARGRVNGWKAAAGRRARIPEGASTPSSACAKAFAAAWRACVELPRPHSASARS